MKVVPPTAAGIADAARAIRDGQVVAYPTDTVYGLGADPFNVDALEKIFALKRRQKDAPLLLIAADIDQVEAIVESISPAARRYADAFWPGPLSLLLPRSHSLPEMVTAGLSQVCVRIPDHETARALCGEVGRVIVSTSANPSGEAPAYSVAELQLPGIAIAIDEGALSPGPPSTILDPETGAVLREGAVTASMLARVIQM
jgi:L-threonylcarbamoyladenylate synthase